MENPVIIFGAKGLGPVALDIFESNDIVVYGFLDDDKSLEGSEIGNVPVLGTTDNEGFTKLIGKKCEAFVATDETKVRRHLAEMQKDNRHVMPCNAIHKSCILPALSGIGHGNLFAAGVIIGSGTTVGHYNVINAGAIVDYGCTIADYANIGAGVTLANGVIVEDGAFIGTGVTVVAGVTIGKNARIGAGSVVVASVEKNTTVFGNPAVKV